MSDPATLIPEIWMYHEVEAPEGKMFLASEVPGLKRIGWVETPAQFGKGIKPRVRGALRQWGNFWGIIFPKG
jgi:hypothetical protein